MTQKAPFAQIHEQGYERYTGARSEQGSRFWIVAKNVASIAWRSRWAVKIPIVLTALTVMALAGVMFLSKGAQVPQPGSGQLVPIEVAIILGSTGWLTLLATILGTALGCSTVADDLKVGAFQFYFSRSLRANDYAIGKLLGVAAVVGVPLLVAPTLLALVRVGLCKDATELGETWAILPRAVAWGLSGTLTFTLVSIGLGAALANRRAAQAGFLVWYLVIGEHREGRRAGHEDARGWSVRPGRELGQRRSADLRSSEGQPHARLVAIARGARRARGGRLRRSAVARARRRGVLGGRRVVMASAPGPEVGPPPSAPPASAPRPAVVEVREVSRWYGQVIALANVWMRVEGRHRGPARAQRRRQVDVDEDPRGLDGAVARRGARARPLAVA
jgi:hypothetical protein